MIPSDVDGFLFSSEGDELTRLAATVNAPGEVVEIGSFKGRSTAFLAEGCRQRGKGIVIAVDHFKGSPEHEKDPDIVALGTTLPAFKTNLVKCGLSEYVVAFPGESHLVARHWTMPIRLLFIDGAHDRFNVERDFASWSPFVRPGGVVAFHDYGNGAFPEVTQFIDEVKANPEYREAPLVNSLAVFEKR